MLYGNEAHPQNLCAGTSRQGIVDVTTQSPSNFVTEGMRVYPGETVSFDLRFPNQTANINQETRRRRAKSDVLSCLSGCPWEDYVVPNITGVSKQYPIEFFLASTRGAEVEIGPDQISADRDSATLSVPLPQQRSLQEVTVAFEPRAWVLNAERTPCNAKRCSRGTFEVCAAVSSEARATGIADMLRKGVIAYADFVDEDFLNDTLRDQLESDAKGVRSVLVSAIIDHVNAFHSNADGLPSGNDAHQYLRYALTLERSNRTIQNMLLKYHSANNDMDEYIRTIMQRHGPQMAEVEKADPPLGWDVISGAVNDSILVGSAVATRRAPPSNNDLSEAAAYWNAGADEYERFLEANPSEAKRREHRDRYAYLRLLAAQSLFTAGDLQDLRDSVSSVDRLSSFYADAIAGVVHSINLSARTMIVQNVDPEKSSSTSGDQESEAAGSLAEADREDPGGNAMPVATLGLRVYRLPESASFASPAQILVIQPEDVPATCVVSDLLVRDPNMNSILLGCQDGSVYLSSKPQEFSEILSPQEMRRNSRIPGREGARFITSNDGRVLAVVTNAGGRVLAAEEIGEGGGVAAIPANFVEPLQKTWYLARQKRSTDPRTAENVGYIRRSRLGLSERQIEVYDVRTGEMHTFPVDENVNIHKVGVLYGEEPGSLLVAAYTENEWIIYGSEGRLGSFGRRPGDELFSTPNGLIVRVSAESGAGRIEAYHFEDGLLESVFCSACAFALPPEAEDRVPAVSAVWHGDSGIIAAETVAGIALYPLSRTENQIGLESPSGPPGQPLYLVAREDAGLIIGPSDAGEVTSWRFDSVGGESIGQ